MSQPPTTPPSGPYGTDPYQRPQSPPASGPGYPPYAAQPDYGQTQPGYGQPGYGQAQPGYGQAPSYGQQPAYGQPGGYPPPDTSGSPGPARSPRRSSKVPILAAVGVVAAIALGGGAFAYSKLASTGAQPDTVIPASAVGFVRVDLDPSAGQKIAAVRFLDKLPAVKRAQDAGGDPRESLWKSITQQDKALSGVSYETDIKPWLGSRAAAAVLAQSTAKDKPAVMFALAVTDEAKARESLTSILAKKGVTDTDVTMKSGYAILTEKGTTSIVMAEIDKGSIATNQTYLSDANALGDLGIASVWVDAGAVKGASWADALAKSTPSSNMNANLDQLKGRVMAALRFDANYLEVAGITRGAAVQLPSGATGGEVASLPADTVAAMSIAGLDAALKDNWPALSSNFSARDIANVEDQLGITLPDDLALLLGRSFTVALPDQDWSRFSKDPRVGLKVVTTDGARAESIIAKMLDQAGGASSIATSRRDNTIYLATNPSYLDSLSQTGTLGSSETFKLAVADGQTAQSAIFVDLDKVEGNYLKDIPEANEYKSALEAIRAVGFSTRATGPGDASFAMRLVAN
jgi:hypothetical protein